MDASALILGGGESGPLFDKQLTLRKGFLCAPKWFCLELIKPTVPVVHRKCPRSKFRSGSCLLPRGRMLLRESELVCSRRDWFGSSASYTVGTGRDTLLGSTRATVALRTLGASPTEVNRICGAPGPLWSGLRRQPHPAGLSQSLFLSPASQRNISLKKQRGRSILSSFFCCFRDYNVEAPPPSSPSVLPPLVEENGGLQKVSARGKR